MTPARHLACLYDQYVAAVRRGDDQIADAFAAWLGAFWDAGPAEPKAAPSANSLLGGIGRGVRWYQTETVVLGYVRGWPRRGCYQVPIAELRAGADRVAAAA